jgi:subtilisin family serine protease
MELVALISPSSRSSLVTLSLEMSMLYKLDKAGSSKSQSGQIETSSGQWARQQEVFPLELVKLTALMERTSGSPAIKIGLIDGPVVTQHVDLAGESLREIAGYNGAMCTQPNSTACVHGTFVAGILSAKRNSRAPAICPNCTLLIRPIFSEMTSGRKNIPSATPVELAAAIMQCIQAGARIINLSLALATPSTRGGQALEEALNQAVSRGVIIVAAAGNQGTLGSSAITRHPWVIPVVACDLDGRPMSESNLATSIGRRGLSAPGEGIFSLGSGGQSYRFTGTSVAVPFVTGTIALLWSEFPAASPSQIKLAVTQAATQRRASLAPPVLDAGAAYRTLLRANGPRRFV